MTFDELKNINDFLKNEYIKNKAIEERLKKDRLVEEKTINDCKDAIDEYIKKKTVLIEASNDAREKSIKVFEGVATNALQTILGDNLSVVIEVGELNGNKTIDFLIKSVYGEEEVIVDPTSEDGGGAADVVALAAFIAMNSFLSDENDAPLVLDEPTKFVSAGNALDVSKFLKSVSEDFGKQIIMVTHDGVSKEIADKAYMVKLNNLGTSEITEVTVPKLNE